MTEKPLFCRRFRAIKRNEPNGVGSTDSALTITDAVEEHRAMAVEANIRNHSPFSTENEAETWQSLGAVAARLVRRAGK